MNRKIVVFVVLLTLFSSLFALNKPKFTTLTLKYSTDDGSTWKSVKGDFSTGFLLALDSTSSDTYTLDLGDSTSTNLKIDEGKYPFALTSTPTTEFFNWWKAKGVTATADSSSKNGVLWKIIHGTAPTFYIKADASGNLSIIDGLSALGYTESGTPVSSKEAPYEIDSDYPKGNYEYTGTISSNSVDSLPIKIKLRIATLEELQNEALQNAKANSKMTTPEYVIGESSSVINFNISVKYPKLQGYITDDLKNDIKINLSDGRLFKKGCEISVKNNGAVLGTYVATGNESEIYLRDITSSSRVKFNSLSNKTDTWQISFKGTTPGTYFWNFYSVVAKDGDFGNSTKETVIAGQSTNSLILKSASKWYDGQGEPSDNLGEDGDYYLNSKNGDFYKKENGTWVKRGNIKGIQGPQGAQGSTGEKGTDGKQGKNGAAALLKTTKEPAGKNCEYGGLKIETGVDLNGNGILDSNEINKNSVSFICNGAPTDAFDVTGSGCSIQTVDDTSNNFILFSLIFLLSILFSLKLIGNKKN